MEILKLFFFSQGNGECNAWLEHGPEPAASLYNNGTTVDPPSVGLNFNYNQHGGEKAFYHQLLYLAMYTIIAEV